MTWDSALKRASTNLEAVPLPGAATLPALITAKELQGTHFPPVSWVVHDLVPEGLTLLAGKPKLGKSWLALQIGLGVATGGEVLGRPVEQGTVLYAAMEDDYRRLKSRLGKCAGGLAAVARDLLLTTEWPRLDAGDWKRLTAGLGAIPWRGSSSSTPWQRCVRQGKPATASIPRTTPRFAACTRWRTRQASGSSASTTSGRRMRKTHSIPSQDRPV